MKYQVHLTASERQALKQFVACGKKQARHITRGATPAVAPLI